MESSFQNELDKLKYEMKNQQEEFKQQLQSLRSEAQRNIDKRMQAEQDLH